MMCLSMTTSWDTVAMTDTTGLSYRMTAGDVTAAASWEQGIRSAPKLATNLALEFAFDGEGTTAYGNSDALTAAVKSDQNWFNFVNHTYSHANLDAITYTLALDEIRQNHQMASSTSSLSLSHYHMDSLVQPDISGLDNPEFLRAARDFGLTFLIADPRAGWTPQPQRRLLQHPPAQPPDHPSPPLQPLLQPDHPSRVGVGLQLLLRPDRHLRRWHLALLGP